MSAGMLFASLNGSRRQLASLKMASLQEIGIPAYVPPVEWRWLYWLLCSAPSIAGLIVLLIKLLRRK